MRITLSLALMVLATCATPLGVSAQTIENMPLVAGALVLENLAPVELTSTVAAPEPTVAAPEPTVVAASLKRQAPPDLDALSGQPQRPGALMLCGGGSLPRAVLEAFFVLGRASQGSLVIIPSASAQADTGDFSPMLKTWQNFSWSQIQILHAPSRLYVQQSPDFIEPLKQATAVWISGGDQNRLAERYLGTAVETELERLMQRGGIVGGSSAGAAIASRVMIAGGQQRPLIASGLDLLPGGIVDQHFSQRKRFARLASALDQHPDHFGVGIDEGTGLVVSLNEAQVIGAGSVYFYPPRQQLAADQPPRQYTAGSRFDLPSYLPE